MTTLFRDRHHVRALMVLPCKACRWLVRKHLWHVLAELANGKTEPLEEQRCSRPGGALCNRCRPSALHVRQRHREQLSVRAQSLPPGVAIADDCQHKCGLRSRLRRDAAVLRSQLLNKVLLTAIFYQVDLSQHALISITHSPWPYCWVREMQAEMLDSASMQLLLAVGCA